MPSERDAVDAMLAQWRRRRPDLDSSGMEVVSRILLLSGVLQARLKRILAPAGLAPWEYDVLAALRRADDPAGVTPKQLCGSAQLTSGAMTHRLDRLADRGLVQRRAVKDDRRSVRVVLTARGRSLVDGIVGARMTDAADCLTPLARKERGELAGFLRVVLAELEQRGEVEGTPGP